MDASDKVGSASLRALIANTAPEDPALQSTRLQLARALLREDSSRKAVSELVTLLRDNPHHPDTLLLLAEALHRCGETGRASLTLQRARNVGADLFEVTRLEVLLETPGSGQLDPFPDAPPTLGDDQPLERVTAALDSISPDLGFAAPPKERATAALEPITSAPHERPTEALSPVSAEPEINRATEALKPLQWNDEETVQAAPPTPSPLEWDDEETSTGSFQRLSGESIARADQNLQKYRTSQVLRAVSLDPPHAPGFLDKEEPTESVAPPVLQEGEPTESVAPPTLPPLAFEENEVTIPAAPPAPKPAPRARPPRPPTAPPRLQGALVRDAHLPPGTAKPRVDASASMRAQFRDPALLDKLALAAEKRVARKIDTRRDMPAVEKHDDTTRVHKLLPALSLIALTSIVLVGSLIVWPAMYRQSTVSQIEEALADAEKARTSDTLQGYLDAASVLRGMQDPEHAPQTLGRATETYLQTIHIEDIALSRKRLLAHQALIHTTLEVRFGHPVTPSGASILQKLDRSGHTFAAQYAARALLLLQRGATGEALQNLDTGLTYWPGSVSLRLLRASALERLGRPEEAHQALTEASQRNTRSPDVAFALGQYYAAHQDPRALGLYNEILQNLSPGHEEALIARSLHLIRIHRDLNEAREDLRKLLSRPDGDVSQRHKARAHYVTAQYHLKTKDPKLAEIHLRKASQIDDQQPEALFALVDLLIQDNRLSAAREALEEARETFGDNKSLKTAQAHLLLAEGDLVLSAKTLGQPALNDANGQKLLGMLWLEQEQHARAERALTASLKASPSQETEDLLRQAKANQGHPEALQQLRTRAKKRDATAKEHWQYGRALLSQDRATKAIPHLERAHNLDPRGSFRHHFPPGTDLCKAHLRRGAWNQARRACERALSVRPDYQRTRLHLSRLEQWTGSPRQAALLMHTAIEENPQDTTLHKQRIRAYLEAERDEDAEKAINQYLTKNHEDRTLLFLQGLLNEQRGKYSVARGYFQRAAGRLSPPPPEISLAMARALLRDNKVQEAGAFYHHLLQDPFWGGWAHASLSQSHRRAGNWHKALSEAKKSLARLRKLNVAPRHRRVALEANAEALELRYGPEHPKVRQARQRLQSP